MVALLPIMRQEVRMEEGMTFEIKKLKTWTGRDGYGSQGELYIDGTLAAKFHDDGNGGEVRWDFANGDARAKLNAHVATLPDQVILDMTLKADKDSFLGQLIDDNLNDKRWRRFCKTKVLFRLPTDEEGAYRTIKGAYTDRVKAHILGKYGKDVEILNDKYGNLVGGQ